MKFRGSIKIPRNRANSVAQLEIPRPAENWALIVTNVLCLSQLLLIWGMLPFFFVSILEAGMGQRDVGMNGQAGLVIKMAE